ncbi:hypothetical protein ACFVZX_42320, partial [Streptomyces erythrochromogenes]
PPAWGGSVVDPAPAGGPRPAGVVGSPRAPPPPLGSSRVYLQLLDLDDLDHLELISAQVLSQLR